MKKIFTFSNIQALLFLLLSIAETVVMILFKPLPIHLILILQFLAILCIAEIRFASQIAYLGNRWHTRWNRRYKNKENDEPSDFAIDVTKAVGYIFLLLLQIFLFL